MQIPHEGHDVLQDILQCSRYLQCRNCYVLSLELAAWGLRQGRTKEAHDVAVRAACEFERQVQPHGLAHVRKSDTRVLAQCSQILVATAGVDAAREFLFRHMPKEEVDGACRATYGLILAKSSDVDGTAFLAQSIAENPNWYECEYALAQLCAKQKDYRGVKNHLARAAATHHVDPLKTRCTLAQILLSIPSVEETRCCIPDVIADSEVRELADAIGLFCDLQSGRRGPSAELLQQMRLLQAVVSGLDARFLDPAMESRG